MHRRVSRRRVDFMSVGFQCHFSCALARPTMWRPIRGGNLSCPLIQRLHILRPVALGYLGPNYAILRGETGVPLRPLVSVIVGDVTKREIDVHEGTCHSKSFVAETSVEESERGLRDRNAFGKERQRDKVAIVVHRWVVPRFVKGELGVGNEPPDMFYLGAFARRARRHTKYLLTRSASSAQCVRPEFLAQ
jgi:hypothetical protein